MRASPTDADADADDRGRWGALRRVLAPHRLALAVGLTLVFSLRVVMDASAIGFLTRWELVLAAGLHALELLPIGVGVLLVYGLADEVLPHQVPWRLAAFVAILFAATAALAFGYFVATWGFARVPAVSGLITQTATWATPGVLCALIADADRRARRMQSQALAVAAEQARLAREETEQHLQLLQAQIEPHFLFNTLANLRRLYRTQPEAGARMFERLQRYLRSALPQLRRRHAPLGDELIFVEAYLELFGMRMQDRLHYAIDVPSALQELDFPPVLLLTLVENALRHGLDPKPGGGRVDVTARVVGDRLCVEVVDDGVGFGGASTGGTGVGLINVRRRLATLHGPRAGLVLSPRPGGGVVARVTLPAVAAAAAAPGSYAAASTA